MKFLKILPCLCLTTACNFNQFLASSAQKDAIDQKLSLARYEFDRGNFNEALDKALEAYGEDPSYEDSSILIGYIYLRKSGLGVFSISRSLIADKKTGEENDKASSLFSSLSEVLGVDATEIEYLISGDPAELGGATIYLPKTADAARDSESTIISNINLAIQYFCPFVSDEAKLLDEDSPLYDERHTEENCTPSPYEVKSGGKSNFGWSLAHLGEAVAFYSVLFFRDEGEDKSNLERGVASLASVTNPASYSTQIATLATAMDTIFPTDTDTASSSMLNAMFNNLETTNRGFGAAGAPDDVTDSVSKAIADIKQRTDQISSSSQNTKALKEKLTKKLSKDLAKQIEDLNPTGAELDAICESFRSINEGQPEPDNC